MIKPHLACDWDEAKQRFPVIAMPKVDGVRGVNKHGKLTGRSLKPHANRYTTEFYSLPEYHGFDGELAAEHECHPDLCRITTGALNTIVGEPFTLWWMFDYVTEHTTSLPYIERLQHLAQAVNALDSQRAGSAGHLRLVPWVLCENMEQLLKHELEWLDLGYEGVILRDPNAKHKDGRCTLREGAYLRIKRFIEEDAEVIAMTEGEANTNAAQVNELGNTFRSTHASGMVPNGLIGNLTCRVVKNVTDPQTGVVLLFAGQEITVSPGKMKHDLRKLYFDKPELLLGKTIKFKFFPKGQKDKPRFPTFVTIRAESDKV